MEEGKKSGGRASAHTIGKELSHEERASLLLFMTQTLAEYVGEDASRVALRFARKLVTYDNSGSLGNHDIHRHIMCLQLSTMFENRSREGAAIPYSVFRRSSTMLRSTAVKFGIPEDSHLFVATCLKCAFGPVIGKTTIPYRVAHPDKVFSMLMAGEVDEGALQSLLDPAPIVDEALFTSLTDILGLKALYSFIKNLAPDILAKFVKEAENDAIPSPPYSRSDFARIAPLTPRLNSVSAHEVYARYCAPYPSELAFDVWAPVPIIFDGLSLWRSP